MTRRGAVLALIVLGAGWGATQPLTKIAVSTGYRQLGLIFWQSAVAAIVLTAICLLTGRRIPLTRRSLATYAMIAAVGTVLPGLASFRAAAFLPSGLMSVLLSTVPIIAFPIALALGTDRFALRRLGGLALGFAGVLVLILPDSSLPDPTLLPFVLLALVAPAFYALEGNLVARFGLGGLDAVQAMAGASLLAAAACLPLALVTGHWIDPTQPWGAPERALIASALIHAFVYTGYVWLVGRTGAVFAVQVSYLVTAFGVLWAMLFLGETYAPGIWAAAGLIVAGMALVQPRAHATLADRDPLRVDSPNGA